MDDIEAQIIDNRYLIKDYHLLKLRLSRRLTGNIPGQFVMLKIPHQDCLLRRPFSIYDLKGDILQILYKVVGKGTGFLSQAKRGTNTYVLGPLGRGFTIEKRDEYIVVAGGIGIAGLYRLIKLLGTRAYTFFGCTEKAEVLLVQDIMDKGIKVSTIDGSYGYKGDVIQLLAASINLKDEMEREIFACGPEGMLRALKGLLTGTGLPCQALVEERMACGIGLCFGCVKETMDNKDPYKRVCKEGPVFNLWQISL
jgi:dihydroorotate dehydrogenase electron transfer subunit